MRPGAKQRQLPPNGPSIVQLCRRTAIGALNATKGHQKEELTACFSDWNMQRITLIVFVFVFSIPADAYIVAPQSITVQQYATTSLATVGTGFSLSIPDSISSYVNEPATFCTP